MVVVFLKFYTIAACLANIYQAHSHIVDINRTYVRTWLVHHTR